MSNPLITIFQLIVLIFSVMIHEISHGAMALKFGDTTAKDAGRLTLNPLRHIDPIYSVLLPLILMLSGAPVFGMAKPVPVNPFNLKNPKKQYGLVGLAGPLSNFLLALIFGLFLRIIPLINSNPSIALILGFEIIVLVNISLGVFNMLPIPPLDGSNFLFSFLKDDSRVKYFLARYGMIILLVLIFTNSINFISPIIGFLFKLFTGINL